MAGVSITTFVNSQKNSFENFTEFVAIRIEDGIFRSVAEKLKNDLKTKKNGSVTLPWGTYGAEIKQVGEGTNITPTWEPSKVFKRLLNDDGASNKDLRQDTFDHEYVQLFKDYVAYGTFYPEDTKAISTKEKGLRLSDNEVDYFLNEYCFCLAQIARDKQRAGKSYRLEINDGFAHGSFDFDFEDDEIKVKFVPSKVFKQYLKNDDIGARAQIADYAEVSQAYVTFEPLIRREKKNKKK